MDVNGLLLAIVNALAAAVLAVAGLTKLVVAQPLRHALGELAPRGFRLPSLAAVRLFAGVEVASGLALIAPATRTAGAFALGAVGVVFAAAGVAGRIRHSTVPCGCFGEDSWPLGGRNVLLGGGLLGVAVLNLGTSVNPAGRPPATAITAGFMVLLCLWLRRGLAWRVLRAGTTLVS